MDIKSLNSKQLDLSCRMPHGFRAIEPRLRTLISGVLERGKVDLTVSTENIGTVTNTRINEDILKTYMQQIKTIAENTGTELPADWFALLLRLPEVITVADEQSDPEMEKMLENAVYEATEKALEALMNYRRAEGVKLEEFFTVRIERIRALLAEVPKYENERVERIRTRIEEALAKIPVADYDRGRLEQEMIYYIEKLDINEEKQRLTQHLDYFMATMKDDGKGHGKKLGFIAQEMTREINTLGSKSNHAEMQNLVVRMKDELEQIKEQVLNVM